MRTLDCLPYHDKLYSKDASNHVLERDVFVLRTDYIYNDFAGKKVTIPRGFKFDGCSRPWFMEKYLPLNSINNISWFRHDYNYFKQDKSRFDSDTQLLIDLLRDTRNNRTKCLMVYYALRLFGGFAWDKDRDIITKYGIDYFMMSEEGVKAMENDINYEQIN